MARVAGTPAPLELGLVVLQVRMCFSPVLRAAAPGRTQETSTFRAGRTAMQKMAGYRLPAWARCALNAFGGPLVWSQTVVAQELRTPVLMVPGWSDRAAAFDELKAGFLKAGWREDQLLVVDFPDRYGSNVAHAAQIAVAVDSLKTRTGAARIDVVAHSMGGLATRYYMERMSGAGAVRRAVFLATPHRGTWAAFLAWGRGGSEMRPASDFLEQLDSVAAAHVRATTIETRADLRIFPHSSTRLRGAQHFRICCPTHEGMLGSAQVFRLILAALED
jgi:triacylglycerol lipase